MRVMHPMLAMSCSMNDDAAILSGVFNTHLHQLHLLVLDQ
jgi:hypothetical protein